MVKATGPGAAQTAKKRVPIREDFFTSPLDCLKEVRLKGTRCTSCGETFLGKSPACENCQSTSLEDIVLSDVGKLYTYTVIRHRPPGGYVGPDPFVPFAMGVVELSEGVRIVSPLKDCDLESLEVDMPMKLGVEKLYEDAEGNDVIAYLFRPDTGR